MKLAIIADDLTGANDSGVQLAKYGLKTSVLLKKSEEALQEDVIVFDTDSRPIDGEEAKARVEAIARYLKDQGFDFIFKKIDSTMRGNIGKELIGLQNVLQNDFTFVVPGYPENGRQVIGGDHYLNGKLLHETEIADDPLMPVTESHLPKLLEEQVSHKVGLVTYDDIALGAAAVNEKLKAYRAENVHYIVVDSKTDEDLSAILDLSKDVDYTVTWAGSAGIANYLPEFLGYEKSAPKLDIQANDKPVLTVIGSVNLNSRKQLTYLLENEEVNSMEVSSYKLVSETESQQEEMERVAAFVKSHVNDSKNIVLYTAGSKEDVEKARKIGEANGLISSEVSRQIVDRMGELINTLIQEDLFQGLTVTGGDTVRQIAEHLNISGFELIDELQPGVPISTFKERPNFYCVTKAGGFGDDKIFVEANQALKGTL